MVMKNPPHPGEILREDIIEAHGLTVKAAADLLGLKRTATLSDLLNGRSGVSSEMALRFEIVFGMNMEHLMRMQLAYDVAQAKKNEPELKLTKFKPTGLNAA